MSSRQFAAQTFAWLRLLKGDRDLTALAVGVQMTEHFNEKEGGRGRAGTGFIAKQLGLSQPTVVRAVHRMHERGRLRVEFGKQGRGHANQFWMIVKDAPPHVLDTVKDALASRKHAPAHMNHLNHEGASKEAPSRERERSLTLTDPPGTLAPYGVAPDDAEKKHVATIERWFTELRGIWARPWLDDEAADRAAFFKATSTGADPAEILAAARTWTAAVEPRFRKPLKKWLDARGWENPPPKRRERKGAKPALAAMFIKAGQS